MGKNRDYSNNVPQNDVELHKLDNGYKKIAQRLKMPISTIMAIIKKFKTTGDVNNGPGRGRGAIIDPTHGEEDGSSGQQKSPRITDGELQTLVGFWGQKVSKITIRRHLHNHKLFRRVSIKKSFAVIEQQTQVPTVRQTLLGLSMGPGSIVR